MKAHSFQNYCNCGGHRPSMNGRPVSQPHMSWCPQYAEYAKWWAEHGADDAQCAEHDKIQSLNDVE